LTGRSGAVVRWAVAVACASSSAASAAAFQLEARTEAQVEEIPAYRGTDPNNPVLLPVRQLVQYLNLNVYELVTGQDLGFETSVRVFADLGMPPEEAAMLDGVRSSGMDLLYASAKYRNSGWEAQLGRQIYVDFMDYMAFDGLRVKYVSPIGVGAEAYGGLWVKGSSLFSSSFYQPDGTRETDARRIELLDNSATTDPSLSAIEPVYGAKLLLEGIKGFSAALGYRKGILDGATDFERASAEVRYARGLGLSGEAGVEYDLGLQRISQFRAQIRYDRELWALSAEAMRVTPVLSSESIWYYFANGGRNELRLRVDYTPVGPLRYYVQAVGDLYDTNVNSTVGLDPSDPNLASGQNLGGSAGAALRLSHVKAAIDLMYRNGFGGKQLWLDLTGGLFADREAYNLDGRISIANIADQLNSLLTGTFYGAQVSGGYKLNPSTRVSMMLEENINPFARSDTRVFFVFDYRLNL
jgi:hypothetical protein